MRARVSQRTQDHLRGAELALERGDVTVGDLLRHQETHLACAIGNGAEHEIDPNGSDVETFERDHARRQALPTPELEHRAPAGVRVVEQEAGIFAAGVSIRA